MMHPDQKNLIDLAESMLHASLESSDGVDGDDIRAWLGNAKMHERNASGSLLISWAMQLTNLMETGFRQGLQASDSQYIASYLRALGTKPADFLAANVPPKDEGEDAEDTGIDASMTWYDHPLYKKTNFLFKVLHYPYAENLLHDLFAQPNWSVGETLGLFGVADHLFYKRTLPFQRFGETLQGRFLACLSNAMVKSAWKPGPGEADMYRKAWYFAGEPGDMPGRDERNVQRINIFLEHLPDCGQEMLTFFMLHSGMKRAAVEPMFPLPLGTIGTLAQLQQLVHMHTHRDRIACWGHVADLFEEHHPRLSQFIAAQLAMHTEGDDLGYMEETWARIVADVPLVSAPAFSIDDLVLEGPHDR